MTPEHFTEWYTVCGTPHSNWSGLMTAQLVIGTIGCILYSAALTPSDKAIRAAKRPKAKSS